jgi:Uma2 family endonuclease
MATSQRELHRIVFESLPPQGRWSEGEYLWLSARSSRLIEFTDGYIEVLPMPTDQHQGISGLFYSEFRAYLAPLGGVVRYAPLRLRLRPDKYREPDLLLLLDRNDPRRENAQWYGADLALEIVSPDDPARDLVEKRRDYAEAGIPEYWIVNPLDETIAVLLLDGGEYREHGVFARGSRATSATLAGFSVAVDAIFDAE